MENYANTSNEALKSDFKPQISNDSLPILNEANVIAEGEEKMTRYLFLLTTAAALSGALFGYDSQLSQFQALSPYLHQASWSHLWRSCLDWR